MKPKIALTWLVLLAPAAGQAAPGLLPRPFAGYEQPAIGAAACRTISAGETQCVVPAMTAGRYLIEAAGTSTSQGAGAMQALEIVVGVTSCGVGRNTQAWPSGQRTFRLDCEVTFLTDTPITVRALYGDAKASKDAKGPSLTLRALPWDGVLTSRVFAPRQ